MYHPILTARGSAALLLLACLPVAADPPALFPAEPSLPQVILGEEGRRLNATGDRIYVDGLGGRDAEVYYVIRPGPALARDVRLRAGRSSIYLGRARVARAGEPAVMIIESSRREIRPGDYLLAIDRKARESND